jgi:hypothetical protein
VPGYGALMSRDLIVLIVTIGLGIVIVLLGLRRNLSETTRSGLPRFGEAPEQVTEMVGPSEHERGRKPLSPKQARWLASLYLLMGLGNAVDAVLSSDGRLIHVATAALFTLCAVALFLRKWPYSKAFGVGSASFESDQEV